MYWARGLGGRGKFSSSTQGLVRASIGSKPCRAKPKRRRAVTVQQEDIEQKTNRRVKVKGTVMLMEINYERHYYLSS